MSRANLEEPFSDRMSLPAVQARSRVAFASTLVLVFLCGALAGAVVVRAGGARWMAKPAPPFWTEAGKSLSLEKWKHDLDLTPEQVGEIELILDDFNTLYKNVTFDGKARILKVLTDEQKAKFQKMVGDSPIKQQ